MVTVELILSVVASALSILATIVTWKNHKDVKSLTNKYSGNTQKSEGYNATQIIGNSNKVVGSHDKR